MEEIDKEDNCVLTDSELDVAAGGIYEQLNGDHKSQITCVGICKQCRQPFEVKMNENRIMIVYTCKSCGVTNSYDRIYDLKKKGSN